MKVYDPYTSKVKGRTRIPNYIYNEVWERDKGICRYCGDYGQVLDHITPYIYCQNNDSENLVVACRPCNATAGSNIFSDFFEKYTYILETRYNREIKRSKSNRMPRQTGVRSAAPDRTPSMHDPRQRLAEARQTTALWGRNTGHRSTTLEPHKTDEHITLEIELESELSVRNFQEITKLYKRVEKLKAKITC